MPQFYEHFEILEVNGVPVSLGSGAMGETFKAYDTNLQAVVALKVISPTYLNSSLAKQRFLREARAAARLRHPNVATVFHLGETPDGCYYAMEFCDGLNVDQYVQRYGVFTPDATFALAEQVVKTFRAAVKHKLVHRDIKPANLMLVKDDCGEVVVKVIDFGLARSFSGNGEHGIESNGLTMAGFVGTPHYSSPEQVAEMPLDFRSDVYSLGATMWFMLTGAPLYSGATAEVLGHQMHSEPNWEATGHLGESSSEVLRKMLAKNPDDRYPDLGQLRAVLRAEAKVLAGPNGQPVKSIQNKVIRHPESDRGKMKAFDAVHDYYGERYAIARQIGSEPAGRLFAGVDTQEDRPVAMQLIRPDLMAESGYRERVEQHLEKLRGLRWPNLNRLIAYDLSQPAPYVIWDWIHGFCAVELPGLRGQIGFADGAEIFRQLAVALDVAYQSGMDTSFLQPTEALLDFGEGVNASTPLDFVQLPVEQWPAFEVKLNALNLNALHRELIELRSPALQADGFSSEAGETVVDIRETSADVFWAKNDPVGAYCHMLLCILGGPDFAPGGVAEVTDLPEETMSEKAAEALAGCLDSKRPEGGTCLQLFECLCVMEGISTKPRTFGTSWQNHSRAGFGQESSRYRRSGMSLSGWRGLLGDRTRVEAEQHRRPRYNDLRSALDAERAELDKAENRLKESNGDSGNSQTGNRIVELESALNDLEQKKQTEIQELKSRHQEQLELHAEEKNRLTQNNRYLEDQLNRIEIREKELLETRLKLEQDSEGALEQLEVSSNRLAEEKQALKELSDKLEEQHNKIARKSIEDDSVSDEKIELEKIQLSREFEYDQALEEDLEKEAKLRQEVKRLEAERIRKNDLKSSRLLGRLALRFTKAMSTDEALVRKRLNEQQGAIREREKRFTAEIQDEKNRLLRLYEQDKIELERKQRQLEQEAAELQQFRGELERAGKEKHDELVREFKNRVQDEFDKLQDDREQLKKERDALVEEKARRKQEIKSRESALEQVVKEAFEFDCDERYKIELALEELRRKKEQQLANGAARENQLRIQEEWLATGRSLNSLRAQNLARANFARDEATAAAAARSIEVELEPM